MPISREQLCGVRQQYQAQDRQLADMSQKLQGCILAIDALIQLCDVETFSQPPAVDPTAPPEPVVTPAPAPVDAPAPSETTVPHVAV